MEILREQSHPIFNLFTFKDAFDVAEFIEQINIIVGTSEKKLEVCDQNGETPLHLAILHNMDIKVINYFINTQKRIDTENDRGETPLSLSIDRKNIFAIAALLQEMGHDHLMLNHQNAAGDTYLHKVARTGESGIYNLLVSYGANVYLPNHLNEIPEFLLAHNREINPEDFSDDQITYSTFDVSKDSTFRILLDLGVDPEKKEQYYSSSESETETSSSFDSSEANEPNESPVPPLVIEPTKTDVALTLSTAICEEKEEGENDSLIEDEPDKEKVSHQKKKCSIS